MLWALFFGSALIVLVALFSVMDSVVALRFEQPILNNLFFVAAVFIGGFLLTILAVALVFQFIIVPRVELQLDALRRGEYLVHWTYTPAEWERWRKVCQECWGERLSEPEGEAFISRNCVYFDGSYESWTVPLGYSIRAIGVKEGQPAWLEISLYRPRGRFKTIRVPRPEGCEEEAEQVVRALREGRSLAGMEPPL